MLTNFPLTTAQGQGQEVGSWLPSQWPRAGHGSLPPNKQHGDGAQQVNCHISREEGGSEPEMKWRFLKSCEGEWLSKQPCDKRARYLTT